MSQGEGESFSLKLQTHHSQLTNEEQRECAQIGSKRGFERAPHRSLLKATGVTDADMGKPFIAVVNSYIDIIPGHVHLQKFGQVVKDGSARGRRALRVQHDWRR